MAQITEWQLIMRVKKPHARVLNQLLLLWLSNSWRVGGPARYRLVKIYVAVADLDVVAAGRITTHPGFVVNRCTLPSKIRQWEQIALGTAYAYRPRVITFHLILLFIHPHARDRKTGQVYHHLSWEALVFCTVRLTVRAMPRDFVLTWSSNEA